MNVEIKGENLVITVPIRKPLEPSKSGKTLIVSTSNGNVQTSAIIDGKPITIGLNAYVKR